MRPRVWAALQVVLINLSIPDSPSEYLPFRREPTGLSSYNNLSHAFNDASFWSARPTRIWRPQKRFHFKKIIFNVNFANFQQHFFFFFFFFWTMCLSDILFFIDAMILLETFFSVSCKDYLISNKISGRKLYWVSVSPDETSVKPVIKVCPWSVTTSYIP